MQLQDLEALKDVPGYKAILKAVIKSQIQSLIQQLSDQTDEESVILTASVSDGSLCHLGSHVGQDFLQGRDEIMGQFLRHCLKKRHGNWDSGASSDSQPLQAEQPKRKRVSEIRPDFNTNMAASYSPQLGKSKIIRKKFVPHAKKLKFPVMSSVSTEHQHNSAIPPPFSLSQSVSSLEGPTHDHTNVGLLADEQAETTHSNVIEQQTGYVSLAQESSHEMNPNVSQSGITTESSLQQQQLSEIDSKPVMQLKPDTMQLKLDTSQSADNGHLRVKLEPTSEDVIVTGVEAGDQSVDLGENPDWSAEGFAITTNYGDTSMETDMNSGGTAPALDYTDTDHAERDCMDQKTVCGICGRYFCEHMGTSLPPMMLYNQSGKITTTTTTMSDIRNIKTSFGNQSNLAGKGRKSGFRKKGSHPCEICGKFFSTTSLVRRHSHIHTGEKRHWCDVCGKGFIQKCSLDRHLLVHFKGK